MRWLALAFFLVTAAQAQEPPNGLLLVAKPGMLDPNFRETVVLVTQAADASTVGVILNRPTGRTHPQSGEVVYFGGPVMREVLVALFRTERAPQAAAFHVVPGVYLSMHPQNVEEFKQDRRLFAGFAGWAPGQLQGELTRDDWYVLAPTAEIALRADTSGMWEELARKARARITLR